MPKWILLIIINLINISNTYSSCVLKLYEKNQNGVLKAVANYNEIINTFLYSNEYEKEELSQLYKSFSENKDCDPSKIELDLFYEKVELNSFLGNGSQTAVFAVKNAQGKQLALRLPQEIMGNLQGGDLEGLEGFILGNATLQRTQFSLEERDRDIPKNKFFVKVYSEANRPYALVDLFEKAKFPEFNDRNLSFKDLMSIGRLYLQFMNKKLMDLEKMESEKAKLAELEKWKNDPKIKGGCTILRILEDFFNFTEHTSPFLKIPDIKEDNITYGKFSGENRKDNRWIIFDYTHLPAKDEFIDLRNAGFPQKLSDLSILPVLQSSLNESLIPENIKRMMIFRANAFLEKFYEQDKSCPSIFNFPSTAPKEFLAANMNVLNFLDQSPNPLLCYEKIKYFWQ